MASPVVTKFFEWAFKDSITHPLEQAKATATNAANEVKQSAETVKHSADNWKKYGTDSKQATEKVSQSLSKNKEDLESYRDKAIEATKSVRNAYRKCEDQLKGIPRQKVTNLKATVEDNRLKSFSERIKGLPPHKRVELALKGNFLSQLQKSQQQVEHTKHSFTDLKTVMGGTFIGGAALNGVYALGNGLRDAAAAGMQFDTEQQKMLATWKTLTGSANQAKGMVNTINDLSIKTGQATDTINELEQGFYHLHSSKSEADAMTKAMLNMGDAVGLSGDQITQVEQDMVHGLATGKVTQGELNQIGMYFPMIDERMAKHFHTTVAGMRKMASAGKITGKDLEEVFEKMGNSGKYKHAVDNMMQTTWGSLRTIKSMGPRLAGSLEQGLFAARNPLIGAIAKWTTDPATKKGFQNFGKGISEVFSGLSNVIIALVKPFEGLNRVVGSVLKLFMSGVWAGMKESFVVMGAAIKIVSDALSAVLGWFGKLFAYVGRITGLSVQFSHFGGGVKALGAAFGAALGPIVALRGAVAAYNTVLYAHIAVTRLATKASELFGTVNKASTLELATTPIGIAVIAITALIAVFVLAYKKVKPFRDAVNRLGNSLKRLFTGKSSWDKAIVNQFKALNRAFDNDGKAFRKKMKQFNKAIWNGLTGNAKWEKSIGKAFNKMGKEYDRYSKQQLKKEQAHQKEQQKEWSKAWNAISKVARKAWNNITKYASKGMENIRKDISKRARNLSRDWNRDWNTIERFTSRSWENIKKHSANGIDNVQRFISKGMNVINRIWSAGWNTFSNIFKGIWNGIKRAAAAGMNGVIDIINAGIGAINKVWSFFTGHGTGVGKLGKVHFAQGGTVRRHLSVINDGDGPDWKELVQMPDGGLFMSQERNWTGFLPEGARIYSGPETRQIMNAVGVKHYADGGIIGDAIDWTKGSLDNISSWIGDKLTALMSFLEDPVKSVKAVVQKAVGGMYSNYGHFGELAKGNWGKLTDNMGDWIKKHLEPVLDKLLEANPGGAGVARWRPYILLAAKQLGVTLSAGQIRKMLTQINTESKGNPGAIGGTDGLSDGHATGLLQFKPGTFRHWAVAGHGNIMSGYDQIIAAIHCLNAGGEGGWGSFGIPGRGWATGGEITSQMLGWIGDNPQHHEFVLNPYAVSAEPLLDKAFEATANAQPVNDTSNGGNSKLDRMISLLEQLLASVDGIDPDVYLDGEKITKNSNKRNAKDLARMGR